MTESERKEKKRAASRRYYEANRERIKQKSREYYHSNLLTCKASRKSYQSSEVGKAKHLESSRAYYSAHREQILAKDPIPARIRASEWYRDHKDRVLARRVSHWWERLMAEARKSSKARGHAAPTITVEYVRSLYEKQLGKCYWTGLELTPSSVAHDPLKPSLDRLDNSKGYVPGNVVLAAWCINRARGDLSVPAFKRLLNTMTMTMTTHAHSDGEG